MSLPTKKSKYDYHYTQYIYTIYGTPKVGKTTICSRFGDKDNKVLFFTTEPGHKFQDIYKWSKKNKTNGKDVSPDCWIDFLTCCHELQTEKHDFSMIAIDVVDDIWEWCRDYLLAKKNVSHESDVKWGRMYTDIPAEFGRVLNKLANSGLGIMFISHRDAPELDANNKLLQITTTLHKRAKKPVHKMSDFIFYFFSDKDGKRWIQTKETKEIMAGDRSGMLPELIPMDAKVLIDELNKIK
jgi:hypothetical protein